MAAAHATRAEDEEPRLGHLNFPDVRPAVRAMNERITAHHRAGVKWCAKLKIRRSERAVKALAVEEAAVRRLNDERADLMRLYTFYIEQQEDRGRADTPQLEALWEEYVHLLAEPIFAAHGIDFVKLHRVFGAQLGLAPDVPLTTSRKLVLYHCFVERAAELEQK